MSPTPSAGATRTIARPAAWPWLAGPIATLAGVALTEALEIAQAPLPQPGALYLLTVVYAAFSGGIAPGLVSAALATLHQALHVPLHGAPAIASPADLRNLALLSVAAPAAALLVGVLKRRTERSSRLAVLAEARREAHALVQGLKAIAWTADPRTLAFSFVSRGAEDLLGYPVRRWIEEPGFLMGRIHPDDRDRAVNAYLDAAREGRDHEMEYRVLAAGGRVVWLRDLVKVSQDGAGRPVQLQGLMVDITRQKEAEEALREGEERYRLAALAVREVIWDHDLLTGEVWRSASMESLFGYSGREVDRLAAWWYERIHPEDRDRVVAGVKDVVRSGAASWKDEYRFRRADGTFAYVMDRGFVMHDATGRAVRIIGATLDISERRETEERLRTRERQLREAQRAGRVGTWEWDVRSGAVAWSEETYRIFGLDPETFTPTYREVLARLHPADRGRVKAIVRHTVKGRKPFSVEYRITTPGGRIRHVLAQGEVVAGETGRPMRMVGIAQDITERRAAEEEARRTTEMLQALVQASPLAIVILDREARVQMWSPAAEELFGWTAREVLGRVPPTIPEGHVAVFRALVDAEFRGERLAAVEARRVRRDGTEIDVGIWSAPLRDAAGTIVATMGILADISERKRAESALRESESQFRAVFEGALDALVILDDQFTVSDANPAACDLLGLSHEEVIGRPAREFVEPGREPEAERFFGVLRTRGQLRGEYRIRASDGSLKHVACSARASVLPGRHLTILRDVTLGRRLEEQLRQSQKMEAIGRLAGGVAHDFNNLLTAILGSADLILARLPHAAPIREEAEEVRRAAMRAAALTGQLLAFGRRQVLQERIVDLNAVLSDMEGMLRRLIGEDVQLVIRPAGELGPVKADPAQLEQVILNLALNARDAMPEGGVLTIRTAGVRLPDREAGRERELEPGDYVTLEVTDTGSGMDEETLDRIFEPFFTSKGPGAGTGLGLSTVYGIVKQSAGDVGVSSVPGGGATFRVYLPRAGGIPSRAAAARRRPLPAPGGSETILLVEDEEMVRSQARRGLEAHGYKVLEARDGEEAALLAAGDVRIDLLVTDVVMPRLGGRELASRLRGTRPGLKVLYISGYPGFPGFPGAGGRRAPALSNLLTKPFTPEAIARRVREILDARATGGRPARPAAEDRPRRPELGRPRGLG